MQFEREIRVKLSSSVACSFSFECILIFCECIKLELIAVNLVQLIIIFISFIFFFFTIGFQRSMSIFVITSHIEESKVAAFAKKGNEKNFKNSFQSTWRTGTSRRFLSKSGRLVGTKRTCCRLRQLCIFMVCMYESSKFLLSYRKHFFILRNINHVHTW